MFARWRESGRLRPQKGPLNPKWVNRPASTSYSTPKKLGPPSQTIIASCRHRSGSGARLEVWAGKKLP